MNPNLNHSVAAVEQHLLLTFDAVAAAVVDVVAVYNESALSSFSWTKAILAFLSFQDSYD